jgi:splicing factor 3A subunit 1
VSRNGLEFEKRILQNEKSNVKFAFLTPTNPFHAYYQFKVQDFKEDKSAAAPVVIAAAPVVVAPAAAARVVTEKPPDAQYTVNIPDGLTALELDLIKLTAQFVARNGKWHPSQRCEIK